MGTGERGAPLTACSTREGGPRAVELALVVKGTGQESSALGELPEAALKSSSWWPGKLFTLKFMVIWYTCL